ncbi:MAG: (Fe-S)-binding protein [bacterium]|nr:(Fe-S)-binding protein [bacterium]
MKSEKVSLFIPCIVDQVYPEMGFAMARVLRRCGYDVSYDPRQTCCGQPAFNAGHWDQALSVAEVFVDVFKDAGCIVGPSGSCTAMVRNYYPRLFESHPKRETATRLGENIFEFTEFLVRENKLDRIRGSWKGRAGYHMSCHSLRELRLGDEGLRILKRIDGCEVVEPAGEHVCCGFGGVFSVKHEAIAETMGGARLAQFRALGVDVVVANDPGCILHMRQETAARDERLPILHLVEFLDQAMDRASDGYMEQCAGGPRC